MTYALVGALVGGGVATGFGGGDAWATAAAFGGGALGAALAAWHLHRAPRDEREDDGLF
ncbi:hypothetical protein [Streptomyces sp. NPDC060194]|uniref:hypothetical protein n=1 Tax=Streptomyces sp. NPDC060194 TaxID=3347069 RepID=UPI003656491E